MRAEASKRSRRFWLLIAAFMIAALAGAQLGTPSAAASGSESQALLDRAAQEGSVRVIVQLSAKADQQDIAAQVLGLGGTVIRQYRNFPLLALEVNEEALRVLLASWRVVSIAEDVEYRVALDNSLPVIGADTVQTLGWDGTGITVAILDTGIDRNHPFFQGRVVDEACFSSNDPDTSLCPDGTATQTGEGAANIEIANCLRPSGTNMCDHGPHVAGIAAGKGRGSGGPKAGVAPGATIIAIQVFHRVEDCGDDPSPCVRSSASNQIAGLDQAFDLRNDYTIAAANMSLGSRVHTMPCDGDSRSIAVDALYAENIATVVAAGNNGRGDAVSTPGCISTAITVGAVDNGDNIAGFSNRGPMLDLFAPGAVNLSAGAVRQGNGFESKSGTSMAAPHVTGAWAVLRQADPTLTVAEVLRLLQDTGNPIRYLSGPGTAVEGWHAPVTTPRVNLLAAIEAATGRPGPTGDGGTVTATNKELTPVTVSREKPATIATRFGLRGPSPWTAPARPRRSSECANLIERHSDCRM